MLKARTTKAVKTDKNEGVESDKNQGGKATTAKVVKITIQYTCVNI